MATPKRDLRSSGSPWQAGSATKVKTRRQPSSAAYDIAIIGAGVTGAFAAAALIGLGKSVVIFDRRGPAAGSTSASTALIQWEIDQPLTKLAEKLGEREAVAAYRSSLDGVMSLRRTILVHNIACDWVDRTALTITGDAMGRRALAEELKLRRKFGFPSHWMDGADLKAAYGIDRTAALINGFNGELHPRKLTCGLLTRAVADGMELVAPADVTEIHPSSRGVRLSLGSGREVEVAKLIVCAGYEALPQIPKHLYRLISTWALATEPLAAEEMLPARPIVWEQSDPYLYLRTTVDNRIIAGGEDADFNSPDKRDALIPRKTAAILKKLKALLPSFRGKPAYAWAGTFADSPTGLPTIGPVPGMPNVFTTLGSGGNGITFSAIAADIAREWVMGRRHKDLPLYKFS